VLTLAVLNSSLVPVTKIPDVVILPDSNSMKLYGIQPTVIAREDMKSAKSWLELVINHNQYLEMTDFKSRDLFDKYWLLSLGLLEFPVQFIGGNRGGGKSLYMAWFTHKTAKLFGKRSTLDWTPPEPEYYRPFNAKLRIEKLDSMLDKLDGYEGYDVMVNKFQEERNQLRSKVNMSLPAYFSMSDEDYIASISDEFKRLNTMEKETGKSVPFEELEKLVIFNTNFGLDEADAFDRSNRTNYTKFVAMIGRRARHVYCGMSLVMVDINRFDQLLNGLCTHKVSCIKEGHFPETSSILIEDTRKNGTGVKKWLFLRPKDCLHLWDSHNIPQMIHNVDISFGKPKKKKVIEEDFD
jgi:hypothetical protein